MSEIGERLLERLCAALPGARVYWEKEPAESGLDRSVLSAEYNQRTFTMQFQAAAGSSREELDEAFIEQVVDDFTDFFARTIYPREKFTRII
jgi:hypothetical protein